MVERDLHITRYPLHRYGSEAISETEDEKPNITTKDALMTLIAQNIQGFGDSIPVFSVPQYLLHEDSHKFLLDFRFQKELASTKELV